MPCSCDDYPPGPTQADMYKKEADKVTELLCSFCEMVERATQLDDGCMRVGDLTLMPSKVRDWWEAHKEVDRKRREKEDAERKRREAADKLRKDALAKLTPAEKKVLGLSYVMKYMLQTTTDRNVWEKVDEYTFSHRTQAMTDKADGARYTGNYIVVNDNGQHEIHCSDLTSNELAIVMRFLSITVNGNTAYPGGYVREPSCIVFQPKNPKQATMIRMADGTIYRKVPNWF